MNHKLTFIQKILLKYFKNDLRILLNKTDTPQRDVLFDDAVKAFENEDQVTPRLVQIKLRVGYSRALKILENLEQAGIISVQAVTPRKVFKENAEKYLNNPVKYDEHRRQSAEDYLNHK